jgi:predicted flap endonuclease-1-like 5' DNA nuclease
MSDEHGTANESENLAAIGSEPPAPAPRPVAQLPRPVSLPPRPNGGTSVVPSRPSGMPPPPPNRGLAPLSRPSQQPPLPPARPNPSLTPVAPPHAPRPPPPSMRPMSPSVSPATPSASTAMPSASTAMPSASLATPSAAPASMSVRPAPPVLPTVPSPGAAPSSPARSDALRIQALLADLVSVRQELTEKAGELRKVVSERNTLRARLTRAENNARELSSAARAEAQLRLELIDAHAANGAALRARIAELEAAVQGQREVLADPRRAEQVGLRQIRGIGPAYERALLGLGITSVQQIAALSPRDIERIAPLIKARADRIMRDDWVGQAQALVTSK